MKIQPDYDEIRAAAAAGQYKVYPIHCELLSDFCPPSRHCAFSRMSRPTAFFWNRFWTGKSGAATPFSALTPNWRSPAAGCAEGRQPVHSNR